MTGTLYINGNELEGAKLFFAEGAYTFATETNAGDVRTVVDVLRARVEEIRENRIIVSGFVPHQSPANGADIEERLEPVPGALYHFTILEFQPAGTKT